MTRAHDSDILIAKDKLTDGACEKTRSEGEMQTQDQNNSITSWFVPAAILLVLVAVYQQASSSLQPFVALLAIGLLLVPVLIGLSLESRTKTQIDMIFSAQNAEE